MEKYYDFNDVFYNENEIPPNYAPNIDTREEVEGNEEQKQESEERFIRPMPKALLKPLKPFSSNKPKIRSIPLTLTEFDLDNMVATKKKQLIDSLKGPPEIQREPITRRTERWTTEDEYDEEGNLMTRPPLQSNALLVREKGKGLGKANWSEYLTALKEAPRGEMKRSFKNWKNLPFGDNNYPKVYDPNLGMSKLAYDRKFNNWEKHVKELPEDEFFDWRRSRRENKRDRKLIARLPDDEGNAKIYPMFATDEIKPKATKTYVYNNKKRDYRVRVREVDNPETVELYKGLVSKYNKKVPNQSFFPY